MFKILMIELDLCSFIALTTLWLALIHYLRSLILNFALLNFSFHIHIPRMITILG
jgi:hypothetical protein